MGHSGGEESYEDDFHEFVAEVREGVERLPFVPHKLAGRSSSRASSAE